MKFISKIFRKLGGTVKSYRPRSVDRFMAEYLYRDKYLKNNDFGQSFRIFLSIN
jgi:hypothetical protein